VIVAQAEAVVRLPREMAGMGALAIIEAEVAKGLTETEAPRRIP
jgi:hypothetical protein